MRNLLALAAAGLMLFGASRTAQAQTTDGYHTIQVIPVVVDSGSFTQRFNFTTPNWYPVTVKARFFPGEGTAQAAVGPVACNDVVIPAHNAAMVPSLRTLCPGMVAGSAFGFLHLQAADSSDGMDYDIPVFAVFSRVSNPQGNGFSVEGFAAHTFTSATSVINGLRRMAASPSNPAFQTNCFIANMNELEPDGPPITKRVNYELQAWGGNSWAGSVDLPPGKLVRLLDIFATAGAPAGDYNDAALVIEPADADTDPHRPGLMSFCTVQDNTSFGADFRIAKSAAGSTGIGSNDGMAARTVFVDQDVQGRVFEIGLGNSANTHVVYFKHPDTVQCMLLDPVSLVQLTAESGLEMRGYDPDTLLGGGGDGMTGTGVIMTGDKRLHNGFNNRYIIEVESNQTNAASIRKYALYCSSGSGNTYGYDIIKYKEAIDRF